MTVKNVRIDWHCVFLSLPLVALFLFCIFFFLHSVPKVAERDRQWALDEARRLSDDLKAGKVASSFVWEYDKGVVEGGADWEALFDKDMTWKEWEGNGARRKDRMWGWKDVGGSRIVWVRDGSRVLAKATDIAETDFRWILRFFFPLLLASILASIAITIYSILSYAKSRDDFLVATAHDLTTPLVGLRYMIGRRDDEARILNERLIRIVRNITEFMRLGPRRRRYKKNVFSLRSAYDAAYSLFAADFRDLFKGADIAVETTGDAFDVVADEIATVQIIWNILGNDLKYAAPFGSVKARFSKTDAFVRLDLIDEGPGMTPMQRRHAFNRFWRAQSVLESGKGGFGIGLCVAREAARAMAGDLTLAPNSPTGCIFTLSLPIHQDTPRRK